VRWITFRLLLWINLHLLVTFKDEAVKLALHSEKPIAQIAAELGIKASNLYNWISQAKQNDDADSGEGGTGQNKGDLIKEIFELKKENARLKEEGDILKKAAKFFANDSK